MEHRRRSAPATLLDRYLIKQGWTNEVFARLLRAVRKHPTSPTHTTVSEWRTGRLLPSHDFRVYVEIVTQGGVPLGAWPAPETTRRGGRRKKQTVQLDEALGVGVPRVDKTRGRTAF